MRTVRALAGQICLRPLDGTYLVAVRDWLLDHELRELIGTVRPPSDKEHERWYERIANDPAQYVAVITGEDGAPYGACGLRDIDQVYGVAELWIYLAAHRGEGIGAAAVALLLETAFKTLRLHRVAVQVFGYNQRSLDFFSACGFIREGIAR